MRPSFLRMRFLGFTGALVLLLALQTSYAIAASYLPGKVVRADLLTSDLTKAAQKAPGVGMDVDLGGLD